MMSWWWKQYHAACTFGKQYKQNTHSGPKQKAAKTLTLLPQLVSQQEIQLNYFVSGSNIETKSIREHAKDLLHGQN